MTNSPPGSPSAPDEAAARRSRLLGVKLRALVHEHLGVEPATVGEASAFPPGAALVHDGVAWVLLEDDPEGRLGAAIAWALRAGASGLHVVAESATGTLARRAAEFALPITVWHAVERALLPALPEPLPASAAPPPGHDELRDRIAAGGAEPVVEHGVLLGEVRGLEVCRVVDDPHLGVTRLEVGVGAHDREAFQMIHGDVPEAESLARVVDAVRVHREVGAPRHPLNRLGAERFLRWRLEQDPALVGAEALAPAPPPLPRRNLKDPVPCVASGSSADGATVVAVCSTGVDLELIPFAADARLAAEAAGAGVDGGKVRLVVAVPARDLVRITREIAELLHRPAELVGIDS